MTDDDDNDNEDEDGDEDIAEEFCGGNKVITEGKKNVNARQVIMSHGSGTGMDEFGNLNETIWLG